MAESANVAARWSRANGGLERRSTVREPVLSPALIVESDGRRRPCVIIDQSPAGLRLSVSESGPLAAAFCVVDLVAGMARDVELAWTAPPEAGVRIVRSHDLHHPQDARAEELQRIRIAVLG